MFTKCSGSKAGVRPSGFFASNKVLTGLFRWIRNPSRICVENMDRFGYEYTVLGVG